MERLGTSWNFEGFMYIFAKVVFGLMELKKEEASEGEEKV